MQQFKDYYHSQQKNLLQFFNRYKMHLSNKKNNHNVLIANIWEIFLRKKSNIDNFTVCISVPRILKFFSILNPKLHLFLEKKPRKLKTYDARRGREK